MKKEHDCLIDTKSSMIGVKRTKKCDWDYDEECENEESIMNEQSEEGTAPDYDSVLDTNEQAMPSTRFTSGESNQIDSNQPQLMQIQTQVPQMLLSHSKSIEDFTDLATPVYKRQRLDDKSMNDGNQKQSTVFMPSDSLAYTTATDLTMFSQQSQV